MSFGLLIKYRTNEIGLQTEFITNDFKPMKIRIKEEIYNKLVFVMLGGYQYKYEYNNKGIKTSKKVFHIEVTKLSKDSDIYYVTAISNFNDKETDFYFSLWYIKYGKVFNNPKRLYLMQNTINDFIEVTS